MADFQEEIFNLEVKACARRNKLNPDDVLSIFLKLDDARWYEPKYPQATAFDLALQYLDAKKATEIFLNSDIGILRKKVSICEYLNDPLIPFYNIKELSELLDSYSGYLLNNKDYLLKTGYPKSPFHNSPWLEITLGGLLCTKIPLYHPCDILRRGVIEMKPVVSPHNVSYFTSLKEDVQGNWVYMRRNHDFRSSEQVNLLHDREHYDFFEISQNNANNGQQHYDQILAVRSRVVEEPIPLNNVKIYGGEIGRWTTSVQEGTHRFWRNIFGGCASARFHRPGPSHHFFAIGLSELAQTHIRSMRMLTDAMEVYSTSPRNDLLSDRHENEAYCLAEPAAQYAVYFPDGGQVKLDVSVATGPLQVRWLDIERSTWRELKTLTGGEILELKTPSKGHWAVLILAQSHRKPS